jgi:ACR3 family arsenite efflux pump ArsB
MMYPILCKVKYETLHQAFRSKQLWVQVGFSILVNWVVAPLLMVSVQNSHWTVFLLNLSSSHWRGHFFRTSQAFVKA